MEAEAGLAAPATQHVGAPCPAPTHCAVQRWVWHSRYGTIVIEVRGDDAYVNGQKVVMASG
jgi:hypothetical protein